MEKRVVVVYKGGYVEKDLLSKLKIFCFDLEIWGCLKYE